MSTHGDGGRDGWFVAPDWAARSRRRGCRADSRTGPRAWRATAPSPLPGDPGGRVAVGQARPTSRMPGPRSMTSDLEADGAVSPAPARPAHRRRRACAGWSPAPSRPGDLPPFLGRVEPEPTGLALGGRTGPRPAGGLVEREDDGGSGDGSLPPRDRDAGALAGADVDLELVDEPLASRSAPCPSRCRSCSRRSAPARGRGCPGRGPRT